MKILFKTLIITLVALFATSSFAYSFEKVEISKAKTNSVISKIEQPSRKDTINKFDSKEIAKSDTKDRNINKLQEKVLKQKNNQFFVGPSLETDVVTNQTSNSVQFNGEIIDMGEATEISTLFFYKELIEISDLLDFQIEVLLFQLDPNYTLDDVIEVPSGIYNSETEFSTIVQNIYPDQGDYVYVACGTYTNLTGEIKGTCGGQEFFGETFVNPYVWTYSADNITMSSSTLKGVFDGNNAADDLKAFFVYGIDEDLIEDITDDYNSYNAIQEQGDDLKKVLVGVINEDYPEDFIADISNLLHDTKYYYTACVEFINGAGNQELSCGNNEFFETLYTYGVPEVETEVNTQINSTSVKVRGEMRNQNGANVLGSFFIFGESLPSIQNAISAHGYNDIQTPISSTQVDSALRKIYYGTVEENEDFESILTSIQSNIEYFYTACVEYEDINTSVLMNACGEIEDFEI